ncbi:organic cation transporter protein-like isoform X2 [Watersipora subatra]|uniref:organic cation transporter protein-like isoform X2 n=1 Tax=Watersipora subatra TaxID=2589382 RepID=UPI00355BF0AF
MENWTAAIYTQVIILTRPGSALSMYLTGQKFEMVCSSAIFATTTKVVFTIGLVVGAGLTGIIADRIGRKPTLIATLLLAGATSLASTFSVNVIMFAALRFAIGAGFVGVLLLNNVIAMEVVGPSHRIYALATRSLFWPVGTMLTSLVAYYVRDWNWFQLASSIPAFVCASAVLLFLDETPHYLMSKGKHEDLTKLFQKMAKRNGRELPRELVKALKEDEQAALSERFLDILKAPVLLKRFLVFLYLWLIAGMGFYGLNFNVANLTGDVYTNNIISGAAEIPASALVFTTQKIGRKSLCIGSLLFGSLALISSAVMIVYLDMELEANSAAQIAVSMLGKFSISIVFSLDYFWSSEVFPSTLRTTMVGFCSLAARVGTILSPIIADLYQQVVTIFGVGLGPFIFGISMLIGGLLAFYLPETSQQRVPETIKEANVFRTTAGENSGKDSQAESDLEAKGDHLTQL